MQDSSDNRPVGGNEPSKTEWVPETGAPFRARGPGRTANLVLLVVSYGAGQGTIFLVQTYLLATGRVDLIANFGSMFSFAILAMLLIDFGAMTTLSRETATLLDHPNGRDAIARAFWSASAVRFGLAVLVMAGAASLAATLTEPFEHWYVLCALPAALIWSLNATGLLDGLGSSGVNGALGVAPYLFSAGALFAGAGLSDEAAGALAGSALSAGYLACVAGQFIYLRVIGEAPKRTRPARRDLAAFWMNGGSALLSTLPGQLFFRYQLLLANTLLTEAATGLLLYAKQVLGGATQIVMLAIRIELPAMSSRFTRHGASTALQLIRTHKLIIGVAGALCALVIVAASASWVTLEGTAGEAGATVLVFAPLIMLSAVGMTLSAGVIAQGRYDRSWRISALSVFAGTVASLPLVIMAGVAGLAAAEFIQLAAHVWLATLALRTPRAMVQSP